MNWRTVRKLVFINGGIEHANILVLKILVCEQKSCRVLVVHELLEIAADFLDNFVASD